MRKIKFGKGKIQVECPTMLYGNHCMQHHQIFGRVVNIATYFLNAVAYDNLKNLREVNAAAYDFGCLDMQKVHFDVKSYRNNNAAVCFMETATC